MEILGQSTYADAKAHFTWSARWATFDGDKHAFNLAYECLGRHLANGRENEVGARIVYSDGSWEAFSFGEIERVALDIAKVLLSRGVNPGDAVAVRLEPSLAFIAALYGTLYIGAVFVPCTPLLGADALILRITDADPKVTLVEREDDFGGWRPGGIMLDRTALVRAMAAPGPDVEKIRTHPEHPAIYTYSSGTTGRPKRTTLQHQGFTYLTAIVGQFVVGLEPGDRYLACYTPGYLGGFGWGLIVPMALGVAGGIYSGKFNATTLVRALSEIGITALHCPPTAYRRLIQAYGGQPLSLRKLAYTAEPMEAPLAREIAKTFGSFARGHYGATEVGMIAIDYSFADYQVRPGAIGKPLVGLDVLIVDEAGQPLGVGAIGRIALRRSGRLLFSGDFGAWDTDGYIVFKGRADNVIITSGHTIGAEEIEEALNRHPKVETAIVVAKPDPSRGNIVKAFIELKSGATEHDGLISELQDEVRKRLGQYAYPREITFVSGFERNEAGKISRKALRGT